MEDDLGNFGMHSNSNIFMVANGILLEKKSHLRGGDLSGSEWISTISIEGDKNRETNEWINTLSRKIRLKD